MARLLLIEDDKLLREMLAAVLVAAGHTVTQAADGRHALACAEIDLVISDLVMPGCEGLETIATLRQNRPNLPIIAISGKSVIYLKMAARLGAHRVLPKPFTSAALIHVVNELLAAPPDLLAVRR